MIFLIQGGTTMNSENKQTDFEKIMDEAQKIAKEEKKEKDDIWQERYEERPQKILSVLIESFK